MNQYIEQQVARAIFERQRREGQYQTTPLSLARVALHTIEELGYQLTERPLPTGNGNQETENRRQEP